MRAHGFAAFIGRDALARASLAASRAGTSGTRIVVDTGDGFRGYEPGSEFRWTDEGRARGMVVLARIVDRDAGDDARSEEIGDERIGGREEEKGRISTADGDLIVHGFLAEGSRADHLERGELPDGEFSLLARPPQSPDGVVGVTRVARDALGTRALFVDGRGSIASDHRFLAGPATLLDPGKIFALRERGGKEGNDSGEGGVGERVAGGALWVTERPEVQREGGDPGTAGEEEVQEQEAKSLAFDDASSRLAELLRLSVGKRVQGHRCVAVSFSGGLDSSILALLASGAADEVILCSAYARNSRDEGQTVRAAEILGLPLDSILLDRESVAGELKRLDLPFEPTAMDRALWCLYSTTGRLARVRGCDVMLLGQMADELFGGYMKYAVGARNSESTTREMMRRDARGCADRGFVRDEIACSAWVEPRFPYADLQVARFADMLPLSYKIRGSERKAILRSAAILLGVPDALATAPKKAAQFSSGIEKLAAMAEMVE